MLAQIAPTPVPNVLSGVEHEIGGPCVRVQRAAEYTMAWRLHHRSKRMKEVMLAHFGLPTATASAIVADAYAAPAPKTVKDVRMFEEGAVTRCIRNNGRY
jgi:hypothetical protein